MLRIVSLNLRTGQAHSLGVPKIAERAQAMCKCYNVVFYVSSALHFLELESSPEWQSVSWERPAGISA